MTAADRCHSTAERFFQVALWSAVDYGCRLIDMGSSLDSIGGTDTGTVAVWQTGPDGSMVASYIGCRLHFALAT